MHRAILIACLPCLVALMVSIFSAWLLVRISGAKLRWKKLREIHSNQRGGVQSLSFVLTLPFFIMLTMFIVQVSQLMIGVMIVNYSAYGTARSASVWTGSQVGIPDESYEFHWENRLLGTVEQTPEGPSILLTQDSPSLEISRKSREIFAAAVFAVSPACPSSGQSHLQEPALAELWSSAATNGYLALADPALGNGGIRKRMNSKIRYAYNNTAVRLTWKYKYGSTGPTYNPIGHPSNDYPFAENEVGWDDPITVTVTHQYALLPGPGRMLARLLVRSDGKPDEVSPRIDYQSGTYKTPIVATVTMTNEGIKSVKPYQQQENQ